MFCWAVVEHGSDLAKIEAPTPEPIGKQVLLEVSHCGVCHTDLHVWDGFYDIGGGKRLLLKDRGVKLPLAMGHEILGRVVKLGPKAEGVAVGDRRIIYPWAGCGHCARCIAEEDNMCATPRSLGIYQNGGYATHVLAMEPRHLVDPGTLDPALAATLACSGITVYSALKKVLPKPSDEPIVLIGAGGLGLSAIAVLRALDHRNIVSVDVDESKLKAALASGATTAIVGGDGATERIIAACGGPVIAVIDFVNSATTARIAFDALGKGGRMVQVGLFGGDTTLPLPLLAMRELTVGGSYVGTPKDLRELVALALSGKLDMTPLTTMPLADANHALMRLKDGRVTGRLVLRAEP